jgi:hypothetical protein
MISEIQCIQLHAMLSISQKVHIILPPVLTALQFSEWPGHMNRSFTAIIRLDESELRNTQTDTSTQLQIAIQLLFL